MRYKKLLVATSLLIIVVIVGILAFHGLRNLGILPAAELSQDEVRHLLAGVHLPEALNPEAVGATFNTRDAGFTLFMRIRVKGAQNEELLDSWAKEASKVSSETQENELMWDWYSADWDATLLPLRDDDVLVFKKLGKWRDVHFVLRKRDGGMDIHCYLYDAPESYLSEKLLSVMRKGQYGFMPGQGYSGERRLGEFTRLDDR